MNAEQIKTTAVEGYARIAKVLTSRPAPNLFACCGGEAADTADAAPATADMIARVSKTVGYTDDDLAAAPDGSNLGVGCGNPLALAGLRAGETVLDLGSGAGFDAFLAAPLVGESGHVIGVDLGDEMVALARKNAEACGIENVTFRKGDIEDLPVESASVDRVISNCVINLAPDKARVFSEAHRVLKPGGAFHISDIVLTRELPDEIKNSEAGLIACVAGATTLDAYLRYADEAGFSDVRVDSEVDVPLELILTDPIAQSVLADLQLDAERVEEIRSSIKSVSLSGTKA